ncbi:hypothetical protein K438DRAFT_1758421 [Mycena galopus ATCC 62051]|nr:hypothetical protein K438DRAFT_1758421 [Mycena galopus ATCC 62051]
MSEGNLQPVPANTLVTDPEDRLLAVANPLMEEAMEKAAKKGVRSVVNPPVPMDELKKNTFNKIKILKNTMDMLLDMETLFVALSPDIFVALPSDTFVALPADTKAGLADVVTALAYETETCLRRILAFFGNIENPETCEAMKTLEAAMNILAEALDPEGIADLFKICENLTMLINGINGRGMTDVEMEPLLVQMDHLVNKPGTDMKTLLKEMVDVLRNFESRTSAQVQFEWPKETNMTV